jgi:hypothetical protein
VWTPYRRVNPAVKSFWCCQMRRTSSCPVSGTGQALRRNDVVGGHSQIESASGPAGQQVDTGLFFLEGHGLNPFPFHPVEVGYASPGLDPGLRRNDGLGRL